MNGAKGEGLRVKGHACPVREQAGLLVAARQAETRPPSIAWKGVVGTNFKKKSTRHRIVL